MPRTIQLLRPKGRTLIRPYANGNKDTGAGYYRFLHSPVFNISIENEEAEEYGAEGGVDTLLDSQVTSTTITGTMTTKDISLLGMQWFLQATEETKTQTAVSALSPATAVLTNIQKDRYYKIGTSTNYPTGVRNMDVTSVEYGTAPDVVVATPTTDYVVLSDQGMIYIPEGSSLPTTGAITVEYTMPAGTYFDLHAAATSPIYAEIVVYPDNQTGENRPLYAPKVTMSPSGELSFKQLGAEPVELTFNLKFLKVESEPLLYVSSVFKA